jgi:hypothetical protein
MSYLLKNRTQMEHSDLSEISLIRLITTDSFIIKILYGFNFNKLELISKGESIPTCWNLKSAKSA